MVSGDVEHNLTFMARRELGRTTRSYFIEGSIPLFEVFKCFFRDVGDVRDFRERMSATLD